MCEIEGKAIANKSTIYSFVTYKIFVFKIIIAILEGENRDKVRQGKRMEYTIIICLNC